MIHELPKLPEGYFWRIREIYLFKTPLIQIRRKVWFWSEEVMETVINEPKGGLTWAETTMLAANRLLFQFNDARTYRYFFDKALGDYPPKALEDWK